MSSPFPKCPVCHHPHPAGPNHIWTDKKNADIAQSVEREPSKLEATGSTPVVRSTPTDEEMFGPQKGVKTQSVFKEAQKLSRGILGRGVAASVSEPAMDRCLKRDDEEASRLGDEERSIGSVESSQPSQVFRRGNKNAKEAFDRVAYQRQYMRDRKLAKKEGLTVSEWRAKQNGGADGGR